MTYQSCMIYQIFLHALVKTLVSWLSSSWLDDSESAASCGGSTYNLITLLTFYFAYRYDSNGYSIDVSKYGTYNETHYTVISTIITTIITTNGATYKAAIYST